MYVLAQATPPETPPVQPSERQVAAAEVVVEKFLAGIESSSAREGHFYLYVVILAIFAAVLGGLVIAFLKHLKQQDAKSDEREASRQSHMENMVTAFTERDRESQRVCHAHSMQMIEMRNQGDQILREHASDLKSVASDLKVGVHDFKNTAQAVKSVVELAMLERKQPVVAQRIEVNAPREQDGS